MDGSVTQARSRGLRGCIARGDDSPEPIALSSRSCWDAEAIYHPDIGLFGLRLDWPLCDAAVSDGLIVHDGRDTLDMVCGHTQLKDLNSGPQTVESLSVHHRLRPCTTTCSGLGASRRRATQPLPDGLGANDVAGFEWIGTHLLRHAHTRTCKPGVTYAEWWGSCLSAILSPVLHTNHFGQGKGCLAHPVAARQAGHGPLSFVLHRPCVSIGVALSWCLRVSPHRTRWASLTGRRCSGLEEAVTPGRLTHNYSWTSSGPERRSQVQIAGSARCKLEHPEANGGCVLVVAGYIFVWANWTAPPPASTPRLLRMVTAGPPRLVPSMINTGGC